MRERISKKKTQADKVIMIMIMIIILMMNWPSGENWFDPCPPNLASVFFCSCIVSDTPSSVHTAVTLSYHSLLLRTAILPLLLTTPCIHWIVMCPGRERGWVETFLCLVWNIHIYIHAYVHTYTQTELIFIHTYIHVSMHNYTEISWN